MRLQVYIPQSWEKSSFLQPCCWDIHKKVPGAWSGRTTNPYASKRLQLFWRQRSTLVDPGGYWWILVVGKDGNPMCIQDPLSNLLSHETTRFRSSLPSLCQGTELLKRHWKWRLAEKGGQDFGTMDLHTFPIISHKSSCHWSLNLWLLLVQKCVGPLWSLSHHYPSKASKTRSFCSTKICDVFFSQFLLSFVVELVWSLVGVRPAVTSKKSVWRQRVPYAKLQRPETQFSTNARGSSRWNIYSPTAQLDVLMRNKSIAYRFELIAPSLPLQPLSL